jgi:hypothetical protein
MILNGIDIKLICSKKPFFDSNNKFVGSFIRLTQTPKKCIFKFIITHRSWIDFLMVVHLDVSLTISSRKKQDKTTKKVQNRGNSGAQNNLKMFLRKGTITLKKIVSSLNLDESGNVPVAPKALPEYKIVEKNNFNILVCYWIQESGQNNHDIAVRQNY